MEIVTMVLSLLGGIALFLFGMSLMGDGLKSVAGNKLEAFLYKMTNRTTNRTAINRYSLLNSKTCLIVCLKRLSKLTILTAPKIA